VGRSRKERVVRRRDCPREHDILEAVAASRWPDGSASDLKEHAAGCAACTDLLAVVIPLLEDRRVAVADPEVPSAAIVWWKAQRRARAEDARAAARPIIAVQWLALACAIGLIAGLVRFVVPYARAVSAAAGDQVAAMHTLSPAAVLPWAGLVALLILVPLTAYLTTAGD
jgi:hypothetical protein